MMIVAAAFTALMMPLGSYHIGAEPGRHQEVNPGLIAEFGIDRETSILVGGYRNSHDKTTVFVQGAWLPLNIGGIRIGGSIGAGTGYESPLVGGIQFVGKKAFLSFVPKIKSDSYHVIAIGMRGEYL
jgi:hypothetical protein